MKKLLTKKITTHLQQELSILLLAADNAHRAATDDQSIAETQYDTLAIEASYLAEGQSRRVTELKQSIEAFKQLDITEDIVKDNHKVRLGTLVQLSENEAANHWFFLAPAAAGFRCKVAHKNITVVTPYSPIGMALMGKQLDDEIELKLDNNLLNDVISEII